MRTNTALFTKFPYTSAASELRKFRSHGASRRVRRNPVGGESYVDYLPPDDIKKLRSGPYPKPQKAEARADYGYPTFFEYIKNTRRDGTIFYGPLVHTLDGGRPNEEDSLGGRDLLNSIGTEGMTDLAGTPLGLDSLAPYSPLDKRGTGVYREIYRAFMAGKVRGDEAYAAVSYLKRMGEVLKGKLTGKGDYANLSDDELAVHLNTAFSFMVLTIFGDESAAFIQSLDKKGKEDRPKTGDRPTMEMLRAGRAASAERVRQRAAGGAAFVSTPVPAAPSPAEVRAAAQAAVAPVPAIKKVEEAAAAVTAPVTEASPAGSTYAAAIQTLLDLGISRGNAEWIMSLPDDKRMTALRVAMAN